MIEKNIRLLPIEEEIEVTASVKYEKPKEADEKLEILLPRTDLRVGNCILVAANCDEYGKVIEWVKSSHVVKSIKTNTIDTSEWGHSSNTFTAALNEIKGVELTEDTLLIAFGFQHPSDFTDSGAFFFDSRKIFHYGIWKGPNNKFWLTNSFGAILTPKRELKYVHELQNLYYASTEVEPFKTLPEHE